MLYSAIEAPGELLVSFQSWPGVKLKIDILFKVCIYHNPSMDGLHVLARSCKLINQYPSFPIAKMIHRRQASPKSRKLFLYKYNMFMYLD